MLARVRDACHEGFDVVLIEKATRPVTSERGKQAKRQMRNAGASMVEYTSKSYRSDFPSPMS
jgi:nicotinamidase-related amidase